MRIFSLTLLAFLFFSLALKAQERGAIEPRKNVPLNSIALSDPFILTDPKTKMYYMTGTGGILWKSKDLKFWDGTLQDRKDRSGLMDGSNPDDMGCRNSPFQK